MSVVIALPGQDEIVVAADTLGYAGDEGGYYGFSGRKIREAGGNRLFCVAGSDVGLSLLEKLEAQGFNCAGDFRAWVSSLTERMKAVYQAVYSEPQPPFSALLCGFTNEKPQIVMFSSPTFSFPHFSNRPEAIGAKRHGGLYFAYRYHSQKMSSDQRQLLAYFCVSEVARLDPRVDVPIEVAIVRGDSVRFLEAKELNVLEKCSKRISGAISRHFTPGSK
ncbi:MAG: hypothetical protein LAO07_04525 [Acidobacteriia bacterium]|nr:hypothetical protein [Terriglobia bacterium]